MILGVNLFGACTGLYVKLHPKTLIIHLHYAFLCRTRAMGLNLRLVNIEHRYYAKVFADHTKQIAEFRFNVMKLAVAV